MVFEVITWDYDVMLLYIFQLDIRQKWAQIMCLEEVVEAKIMKSGKWRF